MACLFCTIDASRIIVKNKLAFAIRDAFPVSEGHTLIIPHRHVETFFELSDEEVLACKDLLHQERQNIIQNDKRVTGFNIGINSGASAGQTIFHCHIHLIPRRIGDVEDPRGGIRHIIPNKGYYKVDD